MRGVHKLHRRLLHGRLGSSWHQVESLTLSNIRRPDIALLQGTLDAILDVAKGIAITEGLFAQI